VRQNPGYAVSSGIHDRLFEHLRLQRSECKAQAGRRSKPEVEPAEFGEGVLPGLLVRASYVVEAVALLEV
jgi:hypothetical protein